MLHSQKFYSICPSFLLNYTSFSANLALSLSQPSYTVLPAHEFSQFSNGLLENWKYKTVIQLCNNLLHKFRNGQFRNSDWKFYSRTNENYGFEYTRLGLQKTRFGTI